MTECWPSSTFAESCSIGEAEKQFAAEAVVPVGQLPSKQACETDLQSLLDSTASVAVLYMDLDNFQGG